MPDRKGNPMTTRNPLRFVAVCLLAVFLVNLAPAFVTAQTPEPRDERLWQRALAIHRRAIVIDTHNDITTPMANDDFDLGGEPPMPYRTNIARMKQGGLTAEFFSLYVKPWYVEHGGAARRTLDMIDSVYRAVERHP
jgi:membrane dipeptidase